MSVALFLGSAALATVSLPNIFSDHMVLQQRKPIPVWGTAAPGEAVSVTFAGRTQKTVADATGHWMVRLRAMKASARQAGRTMTITGTNTVTFSDVLIGEVWICSGQSNMQMSVSSTMNAKQEIAGANYPQIRLYTVPSITATTPQETCDGQWDICTPTTVPSFSAAGFYFGRHLHQQLKVPIGLINTSWGGTIAEAWTSADALRAKLPGFTKALDALINPNAATQQAIAVYHQKQEERKAAFQRLCALEDDLATAGKLAAADLDDTQWKTMALPGNWEAQGLPEGDGMVWFRKTITVPAAWAGKDLRLHLGPIDEVDVTWVNGTLIDSTGRLRTGAIGFWDAPRHYRVPGKLVKAGANVVAIRVIDTIGYGGLWGASGDTMYAELADGSDAAHISLAGEWRYNPEFLLPLLPPNPLGPNNPSVLYNAMIHPLIPYAIRGAIWYQGESNADRAAQYRTLLPALITDWRTRWGVGDFPFLIVQLANFMDRQPNPAESRWAELREAQTLTTTALPNVGQALAIDIGDAKDIHPKNKQEVGRRLSLAARALAYKQRIPYSGPVYTGMTVNNGKVELTFRHTDGGLVAKGDTLRGFAICGSDHKYVWAHASIVGNRVIVWSDQVPQPVAVRYAWANNPECNLYNGADLPAVPFRTDSP